MILPKITYHSTPDGRMRWSCSCGISGIKAVEGVLEVHGLAFRHMSRIHGLTLTGKPIGPPPAPVDPREVDL